MIRFEREAEVHLRRESVGAELVMRPLVQLTRSGYPHRRVRVGRADPDAVTRVVRVIGDRRTRAWCVRGRLLRVEPGATAPARAALRIVVVVIDAHRLTAPFLRDSFDGRPRTNCAIREGRGDRTHPPRAPDHIHSGEQDRAEHPTSRAIQIRSSYDAGLWMP